MKQTLYFWKEEDDLAIGVPVSSCDSVGSELSDELPCLKDHGFLGN